MGTTGSGIIERVGPGLLRLWPAAVAVRIVVVVALAFGPASDEPSELAGWDAERFQEIAEREQPAWSGHPVEYPPGTVVVLDRLAGADVVETHRRLVVVSLLIDLAMAEAIRRRLGRPTAAAFLVIGLPLVPLGYQRLDTLVTAIAVVGALALAGERDGRGARSRGWGLDLIAGSALAIGALVKVWPLILGVAMVAVGRWRAAVVGSVLTGIGAGAWLLTTGGGLDPIDQVLSLRGATGWHVESLPGALVALAGSGEARLELNAYRIGSLRPGLVTAGRGLAVATMAALALLGLTAIGRWRSDPNERTASDRLDIVGLVLLGSTTVLIVTAPLLSPQFLVWTSPWVALLLGPRMAQAPAPTGPGGRHGPLLAPPVAAVAGLLTGIILTAFGPAGLTATAPAGLLTIRNLLLVAVPALCLADLARVARRGRPRTSIGAGGPGDRGLGAAPPRSDPAD